MRRSSRFRTVRKSVLGPALGTGPVRDRGSLTLELAVLAPGLLLIVSLLVVGGRMAMAHNAVQSAAGDAARSASISRSAVQAQAVADQTARAALNQAGLQCASTDVVVDTGGFAVPVGQPAEVEVSVSCAVRLSDVALPGLGGDRTVQASVVSPLDSFRER